MSDISIRVAYDLRPPEGIEAPKGLNSRAEHTFAVSAPSKSSHKDLYGALQAAIANAKDQVGNELTAWRDAVGKAELNKEAKQGMKTDGNGDEEEDEDEEEEQ